jgi:DNA-binding transcriptional LysR family regulator
MMELRDLEVFVACVELGSMTRAAKQCHMVQSAVSQAVARLERACGLPLLERQPGGVRPTEAGEVLTVHARGLLTAMGRAREDMQALAGLEKGTMRLGVLHTATPLVLAPLLQTLRNRHPGLRLQLQETSVAGLVDGLEAGTLDVGVVFLPATFPKFHVVPLAAVRLVVIGGDGVWSGSEDVNLATLREAAWVSFPPDNPGRRWLDESCAAAGFTPVIAAEVGSFIQLKEFVAAGVGLGMVPAGSVKAERAAGFLTGVSFSPVTDVRLGYVYRSPQLGITPSTLRRLLEETLGAMAPDVEGRAGALFQEGPARVVDGGSFSSAS